MIQITGYISTFLAQRDEWALALVRRSEGGEIKASGSLAGFRKREMLVFHGDWFESVFRGHRENQFKVESVMRRAPHDAASLEAHLASGDVAGCGPARARQLIRQFGLGLAEILEKGQVEKLCQVPGIGKAIAQRIVRSYKEQTGRSELVVFLCSIGVPTGRAAEIERVLGRDAVRLIQEDPYRLTAVPGIGFRIADRMARHMGWNCNSIERAGAALLYVLEDAATNGHSYLLEGELVAGAVKAMREIDSGKGKGAAGEDSLAGEKVQADKAAEKAGPPPLSEAQMRELLGRALASGYARKQLVRENVREQKTGLEAAYLPYLHRAETALARRMGVLLERRPERRRGPAELDCVIRQAEKAVNLELTGEQRRAVALAFTEPVSILTGGPGVGKSSLVRVVVDVCRRLGLRVAMCAPTGRAAKRLTQLLEEPGAAGAQAGAKDQKDGHKGDGHKGDGQKSSGAKAMTVHRLLQFEPSTGDWKVNAGAPLAADLVITDEFSMVGVELAQRIAEGIRPGTPWLIIGDKDQLPAVSPGKVLDDLIQSKRVPVTALTQIFRQAAESLIIRNAYHILHGEPLVFPDKKLASGEGAGEGASGLLSDCYLIEPRKLPVLDDKGRRRRTAEGRAMEIEDYAWMQKVIVKICRERAPALLGIDPMRDVQVLAPMREKGLSVHMLNDTLQEALNPRREGVDEVTLGTRCFRTGDRVQQQFRNNYQLNDGEGVCNGDIGIVLRIDREEHALVIDFGGDKPVEYPFEHARRDLYLAFAGSIHKAQGSEFPVVIVVLTRANAVMLQRNLLYTATTRAQRLLVFVAERWVIEKAVKNSKMARRRSGLRARLEAGSAVK